MKILILSKDFDNPKVAPFRRLNLFMEQLINNGYQCHVLTEIRDDLPFNISNLEVTKIKNIAYNKINFTIRFISELILVMKMIFKGLFLNDINAIIVSSPPFLLFFSAYILSILKRIPLILDIRDLYPDIAIDTGVLNNKLLICIVNNIEKKIYRRSNKIFVVTQKIKSLLADRVDCTKIEIIENVPISDEFIQKFNIIGNVFENKVFIKSLDQINVIVSGNIGFVQDNALIVNSAKSLKNINNLMFNIIGDGIKAEDTKKLIKEYGLENVIINHSLDFDQLDVILKKSDIAIIALKDYPFMSSVLPMRLLDYMKYSIPIVYSGRGEGAELVKKVSAGIVCNPDNLQQFTEAINTLVRNSQLRKKLGQNGSRFIKEKWLLKDRQTLFLNSIKSILH
ncbi:MAG: glycosyltransferase family 4 protein [Candidatus Cloacimonetes bacterium]|nr:glycosyltransferase family 4 protein [Candidatus Cloacimonadota bacterium]